MIPTISRHALSPAWSSKCKCHPPLDLFLLYFSFKLLQPFLASSFPADQLTGDICYWVKWHLGKVCFSWRYWTMAMSPHWCTPPYARLWYLVGCSWGSLSLTKAELCSPAKLPSPYHSRPTLLSLLSKAQGFNYTDGQERGWLAASRQTMITLACGPGGRQVVCGERGPLEGRWKTLLTVCMSQEKWICDPCVKTVTEGTVAL